MARYRVSTWDMDEQSWHEEAEADGLGGLRSLIRLMRQWGYSSVSYLIERVDDE